MKTNYKSRNLRKASFANEDLANVNFTGSDLRGADFTGANLGGADLSKVKTGIVPLDVALIFFGAMIVSLASGYIAMLAGAGIQRMIASNDNNIKYTGIGCIVVIILFMLVSMWKGVAKGIKVVFIPAAIFDLILGVVAFVSGLGTGMAMVYLILVLLLVSLMFLVGTIARTVAGRLSNILLIIVGISGGLFGKTVGGGVGTAVMASVCMVISKRALAGATGFELLQNTAARITSKFGTSFRSARLVGASFSGAIINNADFSNADIAELNWRTAKKFYCNIMRDGKATGNVTSSATMKGYRSDREKV